ncbi:hypothetical protein L6164_023442 [Bauhinia variegata]|uniref:Uncharacterized protein n=1 Tax=Bauhinia variegata TaxID=167791 RepID=A0ACB9MJR7_BAUVA|nr:hypothetical protein L6164_023442 [Bauhinia variegata]
MVNQFSSTQTARTLGRNITSDPLPSATHQGLKRELTLPERERGEQTMVGWTKEEDVIKKCISYCEANPRFWRDVAEVLPGKSAQDCFDRFYSLHSPPLTSKHKSRAKKMKSPSEEQVLVVLEPDGEDLFYVLEPDAKFSFNDLHPSNETKEEQELHQICSGASSSAHKKSLSTFGNSSSTNPPNQQAIKQVKNKSLHEKYIAKLLRRNTRRTRTERGKKSITETPINEQSKVQKQIKEARKALMSAIDKFQQSQAFVGSDYGFDDDDDDNINAVDSDDKDAEGENY